jgi:predicted RNase H-like nuclease (RuvC/YqgF family)
MRPHPRWLHNLARLVALTALILAFPHHCSGQTSDKPSLGDVARKQSDKQHNVKNPPAKAKKVVTEEDIPSHPEGSASEEEVPAPHSEKPATQSANDVLKTGDQWKASIAQQKAAVADLKSRIDKLNASILFVSANAYTNGVEYNKMQARRQQEAQRLQGELDEQKKNLEQMQETARRAGYGSAVWDP